MPKRAGKLIENGSVAILSGVADCVLVSWIRSVEKAEEFLWARSSYDLTHNFFRYALFLLNRIPGAEPFAPATF
jgi:hypothetical protein